MVEHVNRFKCDPEFTLEVKRRATCVPDPNSTDEDLLERMIYLIAYSNNAPADAVTRLYDSGAFKRVPGAIGHE
jgi:hypothetical protein